MFRKVKTKVVQNVGFCQWTSIKNSATETEKFLQHFLRMIPANIKWYAMNRENIILYLICERVMSYILKSDNKYYMLNDYLLNESIVPIKTEYGTDRNRTNKKFYNSDDFIVTYFEQNNLYYIVGLDKATGDVGFGVSVDDTFNIDEYDDSKFVTINPIKVFGKVFYVLSEIVKYSKANTIRFDSANFALGKIYDKLVRNKYFLQSLENLGFEYIGKVEEKYTFTKIYN
ncbi:MAG: hypothetical protein ACOCQD_01740 [archaeon]